MAQYGAVSIVLKFLIKQLANFRVKLLGNDSLTCVTNFFVYLTLLNVSLMLQFTV